MKPLSPALKAHYAQGTTTLATCWKTTLTNGRVVAATSLDRDLTFQGVVYLSTASYLPSDIEGTLEVNPDNLELEGFLASPLITEEDIRSGVWDYASVELFEVNYNDLSQGKNILRAGTLGQVKAGRSTFNAELRGLAQAYVRTIVRITSKECNADLGDRRCRVNLGPWTVTGEVNVVTLNRVIEAGGIGYGQDHFTGGKVTFLTGANTGLSMEVKASVPGSITLQQGMPHPVVPGDLFAVYAGCMKRLDQDCKAKFNNVLNFQGFPHLPGDDAYQVGGAGK